jgi:hypothetical protein
VWIVERAIRKRIGRLQYQIDKLTNALANRTSGRRVVFMHIPKCAGRSVNLLFKCYFGSGRSKRVVGINDRKRGSCYQKGIMCAHDALFVHGHFGFETLEKIRGDAFVFTMLRDPFDRLRSTYGHLRTRTNGNPMQDRVLEMSLAEFLSSQEGEILHWTDNVMARMLAARFDRSSVNGMDREELGNLAIAHLGHFDYIAFVDSFDFDLARIAAGAGVPFPKRISRENITVEKAGISPPLESVAPLDEPARQLALPLVEADLAVYAAACRRQWSICPTLPPCR